MSGQVFIIADLHLGHERAALKRDFTSAKDHNETIIDNWNRTVGKRDGVFVLGDVVFGQANFYLLGKLNGTKKLILGNHDRHPVTQYLRYFSQVFGCVRYKECILTHIPVHENQFERYKYNVHGCLHTKMVRLLEVDEYGYRELDDKRYICVSADQTELKPVLFSSLFGENNE